MAIKFSAKDQPKAEQGKGTPAVGKPKAPDHAGPRPDAAAESAGSAADLFEAAVPTPPRKGGRKK